MATATATGTKGGLAALKEMAEQARAQRIKTPMTGVGRDVRIPAKDILARACADQGGKNDAKDGMHRLLVPENDQTLRTYASRGYSVYVAPDTGQPERNETDIVVEIPTRFYDEELAADKLRSDKQIKDKLVADAKGAQANKAAGGGERTQVITTGPQADAEAAEQTKVVQ